MKLTVNGQEQEVGPMDNLADYFRSVQVNPQGRGLAVALNGEVIPRTRIEATLLHEGDRIDVVHAVQGG